MKNTVDVRAYKSDSRDHFRDPDGDLFFRSVPDDVAFQVNRQVLSQKSDMFREMFSMPQPSGCLDGTSLQPIQLDADAQTVATNLRLTYDGKSEMERCFLPSDQTNDSKKIDEKLELLTNCIRFADKHAMDENLALLATAAMNPTFLSSYPFRIYAVSSHLQDFQGWKEVRHAALEASLPYDLKDLHATPPRELALLNDSHYNEVIRAHQAKSRAHLWILNNLTRWRSRPRGEILRCTGQNIDVVRHWWNRSRCRCNPAPTGSFVDGTYDAAPPKWALYLQQHAKDALEASPTRETAQKMFSVDNILALVEAQSRLAGSQVCDACSTNLEDYYDVLDDFKKRIDYTFVRLS
jgi:hypothetical protein